jgi:hypothetical protein
MSQKFILEAEAVTCRTWTGGRSVVAVGTMPDIPNLVALRTADGGHLLTAADAERLAVMLVKAALGKSLPDGV